MAAKNALIVAAIDFGTTYSGVAFSFRHDYQRDPTNIKALQWTGGQIVTLKGPTSVLVTGDGKRVDCFGYDAETKYSQLADKDEHRDWFFFRHFKLLLHGDKVVDYNVKLKDAIGKELPALKVFSLSIEFLKNELLKMATNEIQGTVTINDFNWVLTVPAIWNDSAKQFMRKAAEKAGIEENRLIIALEPEAASIYCRCIPVEKNEEEQGSLAKFTPGTKYILLDAGGGTVDITVHRVTFTGELKELYRANGGPWGGIKVDEKFEQLLEQLVGKRAMKKFKENNIEDYIDLFLDFEIKKRKVSFSNNDHVIIRIPAAMKETHKQETGKKFEDSILSTEYAEKIEVTKSKDKIRIDAEIARGLFQFTIKRITSHLERLLLQQSVRGCSTIVMVGGFSESELLQHEIRKSFPSMKVMIPKDTSLAVLKGAVIFGHNPAAITERICKYTYGQAFSHKKSDFCTHPPGNTFVDENGDEVCGDIFGIHVKKGQAIKLGERQPEQIGSPLHDTLTKLSIKVYASTEKNPVLVTDSGCQMIGQFEVPVTGGTNGKLGTTFMFGGTEIEVIAEDKLTGKITKHRVEFFG